MIVIEEKTTIMLQKRLIRRGKYIEIFYNCPFCDTTIMKVTKSNVYTINDISISECSHYRVRAVQDTKTTYFILQKQ